MRNPLSLNKGDLMTFPIIAVSWFLTLGFIPDSLERLDQNVITSERVFTQTLGLEAKLGVFTLSTDIKNYTELDLPYFLPYRVDYSIKAEVGNDRMSAGISHYCDHPVIYNLQDQELGYAGCGTEIYITVRGGDK